MSDASASRMRRTGSPRRTGSVGDGEKNHRISDGESAAESGPSAAPASAPVRELCKFGHAPSEINLYLDFVMLRNGDEKVRFRNSHDRPRSSRPYRSGGRNHCQAGVGPQCGLMKTNHRKVEAGKAFSKNDRRHANDKAALVASAICNIRLHIPNGIY
ncbi:hypothetical protein EVAR_6485_1 [Eumeta japonica]|uniref:Uncharacterized protein n=1 Tax=Eumeta variegata TaxID=151549 RepID=A0A4C1SSR0_EUMVA|nr:hypothetical protein EVAR_6485_1 [Eumeta japonica]